MQPPLLSSVKAAPRDPILGITEAFNADPNPAKVNLGVGVYYDEGGKVPLLECVRIAERALVDSGASRSYLPIDGIAAYNQAVQRLVLGAGHAALTGRRAATVQTLGGTGALKVAADFLKRLVPQATVWISDPTWENHRGLFENAGFEVKTYPYFDSARHGVDFAGMLGALKSMPNRSIVILHACCHNPTGADLTAAQWAEVLEVVAERGLVPVLDTAYQGFADGLDADGAVVRAFTERIEPVFVCSSFSKSFSLYGERVGALTVCAGSSEDAANTLSQLKRLVRTNYSSPPTHGGRIVGTVLASTELCPLWERELEGMRQRIADMRRVLVAQLKHALPRHDFDFVLRQRGMFSYTGLDQASVERMRTGYAVYAADTGRICVASLNRANVGHVVEAIAGSLA